MITFHAEFHQKGMKFPSNFSLHSYPIVQTAIPHSASIYRKAFIQGLYKQGTRARKDDDKLNKTGKKMNIHLGQKTRSLVRTTSTSFCFRRSFIARTRSFVLLISLRLVTTLIIRNLCNLSIRSTFGITIHSQLMCPSKREDGLAYRGNNPPYKQQDRFTLAVHFVR